jgi:hypothetical protein
VNRLSFFLTFLGFVLGVVFILAGNPVQMTPRFLRPVRYAAAKRVFCRVRADYRIKRCFWLLTTAAATVLFLLWLMSMTAPVPDDLLIFRALVGMAVGVGIAWWLLRRREILISDLGIVGLYPNPRLIVTWEGLSGYLVSDRWLTVVLLDLQGEPVEALPFSDDQDLQDLELALRPHLRRQTNTIDGGHHLPVRTRWFLRLGFALLVLGALPLLTCVWIWRQGGAADGIFLLSIFISLAMPLALLNWSVRFRLDYFSSRGHVQVVHLTSLCQRCHYQSVCWQAGLHRQMRWRPGRGAVVPTYEEFSRRYRQKPALTADIYQACCRCLLAHLQEQDIYQVTLSPLGEKGDTTSS